MSPWSTADISLIEAFGDVGTEYGEIETVFYRDEFGPLFGNDQDADISYDNTTGQMIFGLPADVGSNEPILNFVPHTAGSTYSSAPATVLDAAHPTIAIWDSGVTDLIAFYNDDILSHILSEVAGGVEVDIGLWLGDATGDQAKLRIYGYDETAAGAAYYTIGTHDDANNLLSLQIGLLNTTAATSNLVITEVGDTPALNAAPLNSITHPKVTIWDSGATDLIGFWHDDTLAHIISEVAAGVETDIGLWLGDATGDQAKLRIYGYDETAAGAAYYTFGTHDDGTNLLMLQIGLLTTTAATENLVVCARGDTPAINVEPLNTIAHPKFSVWGATAAAGDFLVIYNDDTDSWIRTGAGGIFFDAIAAGDGVDIRFYPEASPVIDIGADVFATGIFIDIGYDTAEASTGLVTVFRFTNAAALTLGGDIIGVDFDFSTLVTVADDRDITGYVLTLPALAQASSVTTNYRGFFLDTAGAISDSSDTAFNWYGTDIVMPQGTVTGTATMTIVGHRIATAGALAQNTAIGRINWYAHDIITPVAVTDTALASRIDVAGFRLATAGALTSTAAGNLLNWFGVEIQIPNVTETAGTLTAKGIDIDAGTVTTGGTVMGIDITMAGAYTTANEYGIFVTGDARQVEICNTNEGILVSPDSAGAGVDIAIDPLAAGANVIDIGADVFETGTFITIGYDTAEASTGALIILEFTNANALTLGGDLTGIDLNFSANLTPDTDHDIIGFDLVTPAFTQTAANTTTYTGFQHTSGGAIIQNTNAGTINWYCIDVSPPQALTDDAVVATVNLVGFRLATAGSLEPQGVGNVINWTGAEIQLPNMTETAGTLTVVGLDIDAGTVNSGTCYGIDIDMEAAFTAAQIGIIVDGDARQLQVCNTDEALLIRPTAAGAGVDVAIDPLAAGTNVIDIGADVFPVGTLITVGYDTAEASTGLVTVFHFTNANALTLGGNLVGIDLDFSANVTTVDTFDVTGFNVTLPAHTATTVSTTEYTGFKIDAVGNLGTTTAGVTALNFVGFDLSDSIGSVIANFAGSLIDWRGLNIATPAVTATAGTSNIYGIFMATGAYTSGTVSFMQFQDSATATMFDFISRSATITHPTLRIYDSGGTDYIQFYDDDAISWIVANPNGIAIAPSNDVNDYILFTTISDVPGFTSVGDIDMDIQNQAAVNPFDVTFFANQTVPAATPAAGSTPEIRIYGWSSATINTQVYSSIMTSALTEGTAETGDEVAAMRLSPANNKLVIQEIGDNIEFTAANTHPTLYIYDAGGTDAIQIYDDGSTTVIASYPNPIDIRPSSDDTDYIRFNTISDVPGFSTIGDCDLDIQNQAATNPFDVTFFANQTVPAATPAAGSTPEIRIYGWSSATINTQVYSSIQTSALTEGTAETGNEIAVMRIEPANNILVIQEITDNIEFTAAPTHPTFKIYDAGATDHLDLFHDGAECQLLTTHGLFHFGDIADADDSNTFTIDCSDALGGAGTEHVAFYIGAVEVIRLYDTGKLGANALDGGADPNSAELTVFDDYDDLQLLYHWRNKEFDKLPENLILGDSFFDQTNVNNLLRDTIVQQASRIDELEEKIQALEKFAVAS